MRACDHQHFFSHEKFIVQNLRKGTETHALVEHMFQFHIAAGDRIADHNQIGPRLEVAFRKRLCDRNAEGCQKIRTSADRPPHPSR